MNYNDYHADWKDVIRPAILKRDGYKCRNCGIRHKLRVYKSAQGKYVECDEFIEIWAKKNHYKVFTLFLAVAHLDHDKKNNDPANLASFCPVCHSKFDAEHKKAIKIFYQSKVKTISEVKAENTLTICREIQQYLYSKYLINISNSQAMELFTFFQQFKKL